MKTGDQLPDFSLPANGGKTLSKSDLAGKWALIYFYPKDMTPGCTNQAISFSENIAEFDKRNAAIVGVSKDSVSRHDKFIEKHDLKIDLISDEDGQLCEATDCWVEKKMYGKTYMGIERSSFLVDPQGVIQAVWRKVKVKSHTEEVLAELDEKLNQPQGED